MESIVNQLSIVNTYLSGGVKRIIVVGKTDVGCWLVADDDLEVAALVVVRYMLKMDTKFIGRLHIHTNDNKSFTLYERPL
jgi:hypothetical protein